MGLLILYVGIALSVSFLCSILESALLYTGLPELLDRQRRGDRGAAILLDLKQRRMDDAISSILTLNTIAHTIGATLAGAQAARLFGRAWVGLFSAGLTLAILVFTEIIPKTLGTVHASRLVGFVGRTVRLLMRLLAPVLVVTRAITRLFYRGGQKPVSRGEVSALVDTASSQGTLRGDESRVLSNMLRFEEIRVEHVMTPRIVVAMMPATAIAREILEAPDVTSYSRIPLYEGDRGEVTGYVLHREVLAALARGEAEAPLSRFRRPVLSVPASMSLGSVLREFLGHHEHVAMVLDGQGTVSGLVTLEDVIETILGREIVDEDDRVADLRVLAEQARDRRLARTRAGRQPR